MTAMDVLELQRQFAALVAIDSDEDAAIKVIAVGLIGSEIDDVLRADADKDTLDMIDRRLERVEADVRRQLRRASAGETTDHEDQLVEGQGRAEKAGLVRVSGERQRLRAQIRAVADEIREGGAITLRQLFYALTVRGYLPKDERSYKSLSSITSDMRRAGTLPYDWLEDATRIVYMPATWPNPRSAIEALAAQYLESPWTGADCVPEIWIEKQALAGVICPETAAYCVALRVQRGYASLSALYRAAQDLKVRAQRGCVTQVYYLRDLDPSGADAARAAEQTVREILGPYSPMLKPFLILGVTPAQVADWRLPTRPNKASDTRAARFEHATSVELDAIPPAQLRALVIDAINEHMPEAALAAHEAEMATTRAYLRSLAATERHMQ